MAVSVAIPKETQQHEHRVAYVPNLLNKLPVNFLLEHNAGIAANYQDSAYQNCKIFNDAVSLYQASEVIIKIQPPNLEELKYFKEKSILISLMSPYQNLALVDKLRELNITSFALDMLPRITRAQAMDVLSSQAAIAGYKAVILAANMTKQFFPMLTTAAGTIRPIRVLVIGAGVAGLQAIATAKRLGAIVEAFDIRPEVKEQIESLGAKMIDLQIDAKGSGGYARELTTEEKQRQIDILSKRIAQVDVVICTAAIPGKPAPKIISKQMLTNMLPGSLIIDIAAETGGNCELTEPGKTVNTPTAIIHGPLNLASTLAKDASDMFAKNIFNFLQLIINAEGNLAINWQDDIIKACVITHDKEIKHAELAKRVAGEHL